MVKIYQSRGGRLRKWKTHPEPRNSSNDWGAVVRALRGAVMGEVTQDTLVYVREEKSRDLLGWVPY